MCVSNVYDKLSSKNTKMKEILALNQMYLPKLPENILKCYRLNLFKEINTGFNHSLQMN